MVYVFSGSPTNLKFATMKQGKNTNQLKQGRRRFSEFYPLSEICEGCSDIIKD